MESNEVFLVLRSPVALKVPESATPEPSIIMVSHRCTSIVRKECVFLVVACAHQIPHCRVGVIANCPKNHVIALLNSTETYIFHGLDEGEGAAVGFFGLLLEMGIQSMLMIDVVACPELHRYAPTNQEFRKASPNEGSVLEQS